MVWPLPRPWSETMVSIPRWAQRTLEIKVFWVWSAHFWIWSRRPRAQGVGVDPSLPKKHRKHFELCFRIKSPKMTRANNKFVSRKRTKVSKRFCWKVPGVGKKKNLAHSQNRFFCKMTVSRMGGLNPNFCSISRFARHSQEAVRTWTLEMWISDFADFASRLCLRQLSPKSPCKRWSKLESPKTARNPYNTFVAWNGARPVT